MSGYNKFNNGLLAKLNELTPIINIFLKIDATARDFPDSVSNQDIELATKFLAEQVSIAKTKNPDIENEIYNQSLRNLFEECLRLYYESIITTYALELVSTAELRTILNKNIRAVFGADTKSSNYLQSILNNNFELPFKEIQQLLQTKKLEELIKLLETYQSKVYTNHENAIWNDYCMEYASLAIKILQINSKVYNKNLLDYWDILYRYQILSPMIQNCTSNKYKTFESIRSAFKSAYKDVPLNVLNIDRVMNLIIKNYIVDLVKTEMFESIAPASQHKNETDKSMTTMHSTKLALNSKNVRLRQDVSPQRLLDSMRIMINMLDNCDLEAIESLSDLVNNMALAYDKRFNSFVLQDDEKANIYLNMFRMLDFLSTKDVKPEVKASVSQVMVIFTRKYLSSLSNKVRDEKDLLDLYNTIQMKHEKSRGPGKTTYQDPIYGQLLENITKQIAQHTNINALQNKYGINKDKSQTTVSDKVQPTSFSCKSLNQI